MFVLGSIFVDNLEIVFIVLGAFILINIVLRKVVHIESWTATQLLLEGVKRPSGLKRKAIHFLYDVLTLSALSFVISHSLQPADAHLFILFGGVTTGPILALLTSMTQFGREPDHSIWRVNILNYYSVEVIALSPINRLFRH